MAGVFSVKPYVFELNWVIKETETEKICFRISPRTGKEQFGIVVKDEELGKRLYSILDAIKKKEFYLYSNDINKMPYLRVVKYGSTFNKRIKWFLIEGSKLYNLLNEKQQVMCLVQSFVYKMQRLDFMLDTTKFDFSKCDSVCEFLACFTKSYVAADKKRSLGLRIEYLHHVLTDGATLEEVYKEIGKETIFYNANDLPYDLSAFKLCFDYYKFGFIPFEDIDIAEYLFNNSKEIDDRALIALSGRIEENCTVTEKTNDYTVYDGKIKIYNEISESFGKFLEDIAYTIKNHDCIEHIEALIVDMNGKLIGYTYTTTVNENIESISEMVCNTQYDVVENVSMLSDLISNFHGNSILSMLANAIWRKKIQDKSIVCNLEKCIVKIKGQKGKKDFYMVKTVKDLYELKSESIETLQTQNTEIFFKLLSKVLSNKYGKLTSKRKCLSRTEVRYLRPQLASEFANYMLGKQVDYGKATEALITFLEKDMWEMHYSDGNVYFYDSVYAYHPTVVTYLFDYEAEEKYGIKVDDKPSKELPDGRKMYFFGTSQKIAKFKEKENSIVKEITEKINISISENITLLGVSELILNTKRLNNEGDYNVIGYVTKPPKGRRMTVDVLKGMNNKELLLVVGRLFSKSTNYYVPWVNTYVDDDFNFYIDYMSEVIEGEGFELLESGKDNAVDFVKWTMDELIKEGCNSYSFVNVDFEDCSGSLSIEFKFENLSNSFDAYCEEHEIFYNSQNGDCPVCEMISYDVPIDYKEKFAKVFEDEYAIHYAIDESYNLKIYKPEFEKIAVVEKNVDYIISAHFGVPKIKLCQVCFIPRKKAYDTEGNFIGIVYDAEKFESDTSNDICVDLTDKQKLVNRARIKALQRFKAQIDELLNSVMYFSVNPFTHVFLNTTHKKQVQILNIEFIEFDKYNSAETEKWTLDYIWQALQVDNYDLPECPKNMFVMGELLNRIESRLTRYCMIHKKYYFDSYACCPECISVAKQKEFIEIRKKNTFNSMTPMNEGGEALIYAINHNDVAKLFKEEEINIDFKCAVLFRILSKKYLLEKLNSEKKKYKFIYPKMLFLDDGYKKIYGYRMERVYNAYPITTLKDKVEVEKLGFSREDILEILITIGEGIERLHKEANIYIGDLNGRNILFDKEKNVYFLDFDGMGVDEIKPEFCTDGYIDPISKKNQNITKKDDWYSFAVQAFYYLTYTHPFNGVYYAAENGHTVMLEIPDKMERRISLLGNHGMKAPAIAESWEWMNEDLKFIFLKTFEGDYRESLVPNLKRQYENLTGQETNSEVTSRMIRINEKFVAFEVKPFGDKVIKYFTPDIAVCASEDWPHIRIADIPKTSFGLYNVEKMKCMEYLPDEGFLVMIDSNKVLKIYSTKEHETIYKEELPCETSFAIIEKYDVDSSVYFDAFIGRERVIHRRVILINGAVINNTYATGTQDIRCFNVEEKDKFVIVKSLDELRDEVYCNNEKFHEVSYKTAELKNAAEYEIKYDKFTKSWIVANNYGYVLVILRNGEKMELNLEEINERNLGNISYTGYNIYIPSERILTIFNVQTQNAKKMNCGEIITSESKICKINYQGFSVITQNNFWEIRRG